MEIHNKNVQYRQKLKFTTKDTNRYFNYVLYMSKYARENGEQHSTKFTLWVRIWFDERELRKRERDWLAFDRHLWLSHTPWPSRRRLRGEGVPSACNLRVGSNNQYDFAKICGKIIASVFSDRISDNKQPFHFYFIIHFSGGQTCLARAYERFHFTGQDPSAQQSCCWVPPTISSESVNDKFLRIHICFKFEIIIKVQYSCHLLFFCWCCWNLPWTCLI